MKHWLDSLSPFHKIVLVIIALGLLAGALYLIRSLLSSLVLSVIVSLLMAPAVQALQTLRIPRGGAVAMVMLGIATAAGMLLYRLLPLLYHQAMNLKNDLPGYWSLLQEYGQLAQTALRTKFPYILELDLVAKILDGLQALMTAMVFDLPRLLAGVFNLLQLFVIVPFTTFFLLKDGPQIKSGLKRWIPPAYAPLASRLSVRIQKQISLYIRGVLLESLMVGTLVSLGLWLLHVKYAVVIGVFAGLANIIPYLGPTAGAIPALLVTLMDPEAAYPWWSLLILFGGVQFVDNQFLQPLIYSRTVNIHPLLILLGIIVGSEWAGFLGMLVAVPVLGILNVIGEELRRELT